MKGYKVTMGLNTLKTNVNKFTKVVTTVLVGLLLISCEDNKTYHELSFDTRLTEDGRGYHHLKLDRNNWQTLRQI